MLHFDVLHCSRPSIREKTLNYRKSAVLLVEPVLLPPLWIIDKGLVLHFAFSYFFHLIYSQTSGTNTWNSTSEFLGVGTTLHGLTPQSPINHDRQSRNILFWFCLNWDQPQAGLIGFLWFGFLGFLRFGFLCFLSFVFSVSCVLFFLFPVVRFLCWSKFLWAMSKRVTSVVERVIRTVCIREIDMAKINVMH